MTNSNTPLGEWVRQAPQLVGLFEQHGLDFCCGGNKPLRVACEEKALDTDALLTEMTRLLAQSAPPPAPTDSMAALCDYIVDTHHQYLYTQLPVMAQLSHKVAQAHGQRDPNLVALHEAVGLLHTELITHMAKEERVLFPACKRLETGQDTARFPLTMPVRVMMQEHEAAGALLKQIRTLSADFVPPEWACGSYRALLGNLHALELDLHQHIHLENNVLFPMALQADAHCASL
jgi:regulator of cell morphogenesis and NO signaling